jgi:hypothetical protein
MDRRLGTRWRLILLLCSLAFALTAIALTMLIGEKSQADRRYREAVAEADRLDPLWRLDDILAKREKLPDAVNSAVLVQKFVEQLPGGWPGIEQQRLSFSVESTTPDIRLTKERLEQFQGVFEPVAELVAQARRLSGYPCGQLQGARPRIRRLEQLAGMNMSIDANFPYGEEVERIVFVLWLDAKLRIDAGELDPAMADIQAMVCAGRSIGDYPGLSAQMSRAGAIWRAIPCLETALAQGQARSPTLAALQSLLEDEALHPSRMIALRGERAITYDLVEQIHAGKANFREIPDFKAYPFVLRSFANRINLRENQAAVLRFQTRAAEVGRLPEPEQIAAMKVLNDEWRTRAIEWGFLERYRRLTELLLLGQAGGVPTWLGIDDALIRTAVAALAAERFRVDHARWPESLDQLTPKYLSAVPNDPFIHGPLKFRKLSDGLFIYSVGFDGRDDGGKIDTQLRIRDGADVGFRLWDVARRRQPAPTKPARKPSPGNDPPSEGEPPREPGE